MKQKIIDVLFQVDQVFKGWHADGTNWSDYDKEVHLMVNELQRELHRDYTKFFTPPDIADNMCRLYQPQAGEVILEPSAGNGAIVRRIKAFNAASLVFAFELNGEFREEIKSAGAEVVVIKDFLKTPVHAKFSGCIANPPFGNGVDLRAHFNHIKDHVKIGGKIVMIVPEDFEPECDHHVYPIQNWSKNSDGTTTQIKIISLINPSPPENK